MQDTLQSKVCNSSSERIQVVADLRQCSASLHDHISGANGVEAVYHQTACVTFNAENHTLTIFGNGEGGAGGAIAVEEAVQPNSIDNHAVGTKHPQTEGVTVPAKTATVAGIIEGGIRRVWTVGCVGAWLVVSVPLN